MTAAVDSRPPVLVACERSGTVRRAFRLRGFDAWSCDLQPDVNGSPFHIQGDALRAVRSRPWVALIAFPPCTYLAKSGWFHVYTRPERAAAAAAALDFFGALLEAPIPLRALENPQSMADHCWPSSQVVRPCWFGDQGTKETHLWLRGLPPLLATGYHPDPRDLIHNVPPGPERSNIRSLTPFGLARAMAAQWGGVIRRYVATDVKQAAP